MKSVQQFVLTLSLCSSAVLLLGCDSDLKKAVREKAKDPDSIQFGDVIRFKDKACIRYNAKNAYGGYVGYTWAFLSGSGDYVSLRKDEPTCDIDDLKEWVKEDEAVAAAEKEANVLGRMKAKKLIPQDAADGFEIKDATCKKMASDIETFARLSAGNDTKDNDTWKKKLAQGLALIEEGKCVDFDPS